MQNSMKKVTKIARSVKQIVTHEWTTLAIGFLAFAALLYYCGPVIVLEVLANLFIAFCELLVWVAISQLLFFAH